MSTTREERKIEPGVIVGGYRIDTLIGEGGMGVVYEATQLSLERRIALKLLHPHLSSDADFRHRFQREGRIQTAIDHPNIVTVLEVGESEYGLFVAVELIQEASLKDLILGREIEVGRTLRILSQVADALDTAHEAGLIHGDIEPHNILVRAEGRDHAYLADLGVTKDRRRSDPTGTGAPLGTADYMAPEQIRGEPSTRHTDIYSLGAILYECLSGTVPFPKGSGETVMDAHVTDPSPRLTERRPELPAGVDAVISTAMAKNPTDRYGTATEMVEALERVLDGAAKEAIEPALGGAAKEAIEPALGGAAKEAIAPPPKMSTLEPPEPAPSPQAPARPETADEVPPAVLGRRRYVFWGAAAVAVLGLAAAGFLVGRGNSSQSAGSPSMILVNGVGLKAPAGWDRMAHVPRTPGVTFPGAFALAPDKGGASLIAARASGRWPTLLPASFEDRVPSESYVLDRRQVVLLGERQAFRYRDVTLRGSTARLTVFVVPDRGRVELLSCLLPAGGSASLRRQCEGIAAGVTLPKAEPYSLVPQAGYARVLSGAIARMNRARDTGRTELAAAGTAADQARAARKVGDVYRREGQRLENQRTELLVTPVNRKIVAQLRRVRAAYASLANAALTEQETAFDGARTLVRFRETELRMLFRQLRFAGISMQ